MTKLHPHLAAALLLFAWLLQPSGARALDLPASAVAEDAVDGTEPRVRSSLVLDQTTVVSGEPFWAGVYFELDEHWHIYWRNPGQAAYSTELSWQAPVVAEPNLWPAPEVFEQNDGFIVTYGYSHAVTLPARLVATTEADSVELVVVADYLACRVDCIPGRVELRRTLAVGTSPVEAPAAERELLATARSQVPVRAESVGLIATSALERTALRRGETLRATLAFASCAAPPAGDERCAEVTASRATPVQTLIPDRTATLSVAPTAIRAHPTAYRGIAFDLTLGASPDDPGAALQTVTGVAMLELDGRATAVEFAFDVPRAAGDAVTEPVPSGLFALGGGTSAESATTAAEPTAAAPDPAPRPIRWWHALLLAFAGGMLLNLMPCVLPVLAIKVMSVAELAHSERRQTLRLAAAWTAGVVGTMLALATLVLVLRGAGTAVGWGFQFQEPVFVAVIAAVILAFALNLLGVFEVGVRADRLDAAARSRSGLGRAVLEGVLAVVLATPCSAPMVGTAVGLALASPAPLVLAVFAALGLGLAAPFVAVSMVPGLARVMPRPGMWMVHLRSVLGFVLLATVVWLLWILGQAAGAGAMTSALLLLVAVGFVSWTAGVVQHGARPAVLALGAVVLLGTAAAVLPAIARSGADEAMLAPVDASAVWQPWSADAVTEAQAAGRVVFVDFTADWCITCKVNEHGPLVAPSVLEAFAAHDVLLLKADWTRRDDTIRAELARHGKGGVPLYLVYPPAPSAEPTVLPELLTASVVVESIVAAAGGSHQPP